VFTSCNDIQQPVAPLEEERPFTVNLGNLNFRWPIVDAAITSDFGYRSAIQLGEDSGGAATSSLHFGLDLIPSDPKAKRTQILAAEDGEVYIVYPPPGTRIPGTTKKFAGHPSYGGCIVIRHVVATRGDKTIYAYTLYAHLKETWVSTRDENRERTKVVKGQPLGIMGSTGFSTGPHLHFEIFFDPIDFFAFQAE